MLMKLAPAIRMISSGQPAVSVKYMMHAMRLCEDEVRLPLIPAGDNDRKRLTGILEDLQIL